MEFIGQGRHRKAYRHKGYVIKVPLNPRGEIDNQHEAEAYRKWGHEFEYARCRLLKNGWLVMEYLTQPESFENLPEWVGFVDCMQVGYNKNGKLLAYDYGRF